MDLKVCGKLLTTHWRGYGVDVEALHGRFPLRRSAGGGGILFSLAPWMFLGYVGIYKRKKYGGGRLGGPGDRGRAQRGWARPPVSWPPRKLHDLHSKFSGSRSFQKSRSGRFHSVSSPFAIPFL